MTSQVQEMSAGVGKRIRAARCERGLSLAQLGGRDFSRSFLSKVERGESNVSLRALTIIARRLNLPLSYFLGEHFELNEAIATDRADVALAYSLALYRRGFTDEALAYAIRAVELTLDRADTGE